jgi:hypothetical protein
MTSLWYVEVDGKSATRPRPCLDGRTDGLFFPQACQLLGLERVYQPAYQLSLDMFKRLGSSGEIYDVLLSKGDVSVDVLMRTLG